MHIDIGKMMCCKNCKFWGDKVASQNPLLKNCNVKDPNVKGLESTGPWFGCVLGEPTKEASAPGIVRLE